MNTIIRNLFYMLRRFQTASFLNLLGLSGAFAAFVIIMMKVSYERNFDTCYPDAHRLVMLDTYIGGEPSYFGAVLSRGMIDYVIEHTPGVECGSIYGQLWQDISLYTDPDNPSYFMMKPCAVYEDFARTVGLEFVAGSNAGMEAPDGMLLSESMARRLFPDGNAVGSYVYRSGECWLIDESVTKYRVCGVYKDFPENSQFSDNPVLVRMGNFQKDHWTSSNFYGFLRLKPGVTLEDVKEQMDKSGVNKRMSEYMGAECEAYVVPFPDIYYSFKGNDFLQTGSRQNIYLLVSIALLIIIVASINLINFSTALTPMRIRSINTQKVLGSPVGILRVGLVGEAVCISFLAWIVSIGIVYCLARTGSLDFLHFTPSLLTYWKPVLASGLISLFVGALAGLYPAFYMTSFPPAMMLKGNFALSGKGKRLRTCLIGFQYVISFVLIIVTVFIWLQNNYLRKHELGIDRDNLLMATLPNMPVTGSMYQGFVHQLKSYPEVADVAFSNMELGNSNVYSMYPLAYEDKETSIFLINVSPNFFNTMGINVTEGRGFLPNDSVMTGPQNFVATRNAQEKLGIPVGTVFDFNAWGVKAVMLGYVNNLQLTSLHQANDVPFVFVTNPIFANLNMPHVYIRVKAGSDIDVVLSHVRRALKENFVGYSIDVKFFNGVYASLYQKETDQQHTVTLFSVLAILISLVGVFGLVIFEAEYRKKEIGIRKVFGASTGEILWMFNRIYLRVVVICFVVSVPLAYYIVNEWMKNFSERISLSWWVFALAFAVVAFITQITVTVQNWRTARANPVESVKTE